jgi:hypothetical protein
LAGQLFIAEAMLQKTGEGVNSIDRSIKPVVKGGDVGYEIGPLDGAAANPY